MEINYTSTQEWTKNEPDNTVRFGLSQRLIEDLDEIVFITLPSPGETFDEGAPFIVIESTKAAIDIPAPFSCEIVHCNEALSDLSYLNQDPEGEGWLLIMKEI